MAKRHSSGNGRAVRAVLYLRMSSDHQEQSIPSQRAELARYAKKHGYEIVGEYIDEAISGDDTHNRTGFLTMRDDAAAGNFEVVLCWDQDRFGRFDILDAGYWIMPFRQGGVRLETIAQGTIDWEDLVGQLIYSVNQMGKAQFLRDLSRNTTRGLLNSAHEGKAGTGGPNPYGYRSKDGVVTIIPEEARVVRLIFREYLKPAGSLRSVAALLNRKGIKPPRSGKVWRMSSVRAILVRRKYTGTFVYGEQNGGKYFCFRDGEIVPRRKSDKVVGSDPIVIPDKFEPIIDQDTFERAQAKLENGKRKTAPRKAHQYLLAGLVKCGDCGGAMGGLRPKAPIYRCRLYHQTGRSACYCNTIDEAPLVSVIVEKDQRYLSDTALSRLRRALEREHDRSTPRPRDLKRLKSEIERLSVKIDNAEDSCLEAPPNLRPGLYRKLEQLQSDRDGLNAELESLARRDTRSNGKGDSEIDRAIEALKNLGAALKRAKPDDTKELLSSIVTRIELFYDHEETASGRNASEFSHGVIYLRPDAGEGRGALPDGPNKSTHLIKKRPIFALGVCD